jgi:hypothetical protein
MILRKSGAMKIKMVIAGLAALMCSALAKAQDIPPPNPGLVINIVSGYSIEFVFDEIEEYINGISGGGQSTFIRIGAIYDWKLQFSADQDMFYGTNDPGHQMQLNNVGVMVVSTGTNQDNGSNIINYARTNPVALEFNDVTLLTKGTLSNKGYGIENSFVLNWEMGTRNGNMNPTRMLDQNLASDTYTLNIILTLSVY